MVRRGTVLVFSLFFLVAGYSQAVTVTDTFTNISSRNSSTAVWNTALGKLHPPLVISNYQVPAQAATSSDFSISQGEDGVFDVTTYANFAVYGSLVGNVLTIDTTLKPILKTKSFHLPAGITLTAINGPLVIHSLSTVTIDGTILCRGENGNSATGVVGGAGGAGRCGGENGGSGGNASSSGLQGSPVAGAVTGGGGGIYNNIGGGGGGGGGGAYAGNTGQPGNNSQTNVNLGGLGGSGAAGANHQFTILDGSPGGGGGSGSDTEGGGGGGGGGGTVIIRALGLVSISATGSIQAQGGQGGSANTGGGGGGGGGGSISIFTKGDIFLDSGVPVDVTEGNGGVPLSPTAGSGGVGSFGRMWNVATNFLGAGTESHASGLLLTGDVRYFSGLITAESTAFDTSAANTIYNSVVYSVVDPSVTLEISGSSDNFSGDNTGWVPAASTAALANKRYFKYKFSINSTDPMNPIEVQDITVDFTIPVPPPAPAPGPSPTPAGPTPDSSIQNFSFTSSGGGCGLVQKKETDFKLIYILLFLLPMMIALKLRQKVR